MLRKHLAQLGLAVTLVFALGLSDGWTQPPPDGGGGFPGGGGGFPGGGRGGKGGGKGGRGFDPGMIFDRVANGRTSVPIADLSFGRDPSALQQWAAQNGVSNGEITREQFASYVEARRASRGQGGPPGGGPPPGAGAGAAAAVPAGPGGASPVPPADGGAAPPPGGAPGAVPPGVQPPEEEETKPTFHRPGKLPKGLPDWFAKLDTDQDGQVGLYEWKEAGRPLDEFRKIDRNGDGFITVEEALHWAKTTNTVASNSPGRTPRGGDDSAEESSSNTPGASAATPTNPNNPTSNANRARRSGNGGRFNGGNRRSNNRPPNGGGNGGNDGGQGGGNQDNNDGK